MLENLINSKVKPHAIIFHISNIADVNEKINSYIKSIVISDLPDNLKEVYSKKIDEGKYFDLIKINGWAASIKKEDVLNVQKTFSVRGIEEINKKFYVIYGIENITSQAANSLLKFLEEPPTNTYAIFVTRSPNRIIETIKSRCQMYFIKPNISKFNELIQNRRITNKNIIEIAKNYDSIDELEADLNGDKFNKLYEITQKLLVSKNSASKLKDSLDEFKELSYLQIQKIIQMLMILLPSKQNTLYELTTQLRFNPNKVLLFDRIINTIN